MSEHDLGDSRAFFFSFLRADEFQAPAFSHKNKTEKKSFLIRKNFCFSSSHFSIRLCYLERQKAYNRTRPVGACL
jgi:hypothetical protein